MVEENPSHKGEANSQHGGKKGTQSVNTQAPIPKTTTAKGLSANPTGKQTADKKEEPLKKIEKQGLIIAWAGFIVACTTGVVFFCQFREMQKQTKAIQQQTRQDQRAWLRFIIGNPQWTFENQTGAATVSFPVTFANTGKTPATFIAVAVAVDIVQNGRQPNLSLEEGIPKTTTIRKILWQGEQDAIEVPLSSPIVGDLGHTQLRILSKPEYQKPCRWEDLLGCLWVY